MLGATKRLAELLVQQEQGGRTKVASVRFGNVLGSRGSLLSVLAEQLQPRSADDRHAPRHDPLLHDHRRGRRARARGRRLAEHGEVFVLDMGDPVRIVDVVQSFAHLMNRGDVEIRFTGMRPGEKLNETLFSEDETPVLTEHPRIFRTEVAPPAWGFHQRLRTLYHAAIVNDRDAVRRGLTDLLPEYHPQTPRIPAQAAPYPDDF